MPESPHVEIRFDLDTTRWNAALESISGDLDKVAARALHNKAADLNRQADELDPPTGKDA